MSSIQCIGDSLSATVTITNLFSSSVIGNLSFSINSFLSPPTNQLSDVLVATSYTASGEKIDSCNFYVNDLTPRALSAITITNSVGGSMVVNQFYTLRLVFSISDTVSQTDTITLTFPTGSMINFVSSTVNTNFSSSVVNINSLYEPASLTLYLNLSNSNTIFPRNTVFYLNIGSYQAPPSI